MKTKQTSIALCIGRYGLENYANLINKLNNGWIVFKSDLLSDENWPDTVIYILEKEVDKQSD